MPTGSGAVSTKLAAVYGVGTVTPVTAAAETPELITSLDSAVNLNLSNVPDIDNPKTYEAVLRSYEALENLQREQDIANDAFDARLTALEP